MKKSDYKPGQFSWVDLATTNTVAAKTFYSSLFGWDSRDVPTPMGANYTMFLHSGGETAGMGPQPPDMAAAGAPPVWSSYVRVDDVEATLAKAVELGATVMMPAMKIMEQGHMAFFTDPTGAAIGIWQPINHHGASWVNSVGGFCWNELYTNDVDKARSFYESVFGWEFSSSPAGDHVYWSIKNDGDSNGGMMEIQESWGPVPPNWMTYFTVESLEASIKKAEELGGKQVMPTNSAPGVGTFAGIADPQGAHFMIIEMDGEGG